MYGTTKLILKQVRNEEKMEALKALNELKRYELFDYFEWERTKNKEMK